MKWLGTQSRSISHGVPKVSTFTHYNKLTSRIVSKPLIGLTTLNQALIRTSTPNLMGVIWSESMINQAFQAYYSIEGCPSDRCVLSHERVEYMIGNIHQLNLLPRSPLTHSRESHLQPQELLRWRQRPRRLPPINLHSEKYIMILQTLELNYKKKKKKTLHPTDLPHVSSPWHYHVDMTDVTSLSSISIGHTHVILLCSYILPSINLLYSFNWLLSIPNTI